MVQDFVHGISYCAVCDGTFYKDKVVGVVGGGNSSFTNALYLSDLCSQVYVFVRSVVKADKSLVDRVLAHDNITILEHCEISEFITKDNNLIGVILKDGKKIDLSGLFVAIGGKPQTDFVIVDKDNGYIKVDNHMKTSVNGIYACGDVILKDYYQTETTAVTSKGSLLSPLSKVLIPVPPPKTATLIPFILFTFHNT